MKKYFFTLAILIILAADALAQCNAVNFEASSIGTVQNQMSYRTILDFNGDGKMDFAGHNDNPTGHFNNVSVLENNGAGGFTPVTLTVSNNGSGLFYGGRWADFNADGKPDFLGYFSSAPNNVVFYNDGSGGLIYGNALDFGSESEYIADAADVNRDGRVDLITTGAPLAGTDEPTFYLYLSTGNAVYAPRIFITADHANLYFGDFNGDDRKDIAIVKQISNSTNSTLRYWLQNAGGGFNVMNAVNIGALQIDGVDEFNRDGKTDFYGSVSYTPTMSFLMSNASGNHTASHLPTNYKDGSFRLYFGDFNGDGKRDVLNSGRAEDASYGYTAFFGSGAGSFQSFSNAFSLDDQNVSQTAHAVDFTGDGKTDLIRFSVDATNNRVNIDLLKTVCRRSGQTRTIDFDGDQKTDLAFWNPANGKWTVRLSSPPDAAPQTVLFGNGSLGDVPAVGDYDGDGKTDHAVYRKNTGVWYILRSSDNAMSAVQFGLSADKPVPADFDGDGKTDVAVFRESAGDWYILRSGDGQFQGLHFGAGSDQPVQSDYDGDNRADIAVYRPTDGTWYYLRSSDNQFVAFKWGIGSDKPVPADYDGDGKADVAVFRPAEGNWYVWRSASQTMSAAHWGTNGDVPVAVDADGNGAFEFNVYRPSETVWYLFPSTAVTFGAANEVPVSLN